MIGFYVPESPVAGRFPVALLLVHQQPSLYVVVSLSLSLSLSLFLSLERERVWSGFSWPSARFSVTYRYRFMTHAKQDRVKADSSLPRIVRIFVSRISPKIYTRCTQGVGKTKTAGKISVAQQSEEETQNDEKQERKIREQEKEST